jgi:thiol-disulfide isomerase/thioredoxin
MGKQLLPILSLCLFVVICVLVFFAKKKNGNLGRHGAGERKIYPDPSGNLSSFGNVESPNDVVIVFAEWCGHCKSSMPEFQKAVEQTKNQTNGKVVLLDSATSVGKKFMEKNGITGFPSVVKNGKVVNVSRKASDIVKLTQ